MQHLDEGTIHAWLDGELPFDESSRVTAHAETCDRCTAMIAEARGFIAASSRILRNLDDVPGGVIPTSATPASPERTGFTPRDWGIVLPVPRPHPVRRWIPSRFAAAAAVTIMAVGTYTVLNRSNGSEATAIRVPAAAEVAPATPELMDSAALSSDGARGLKDAAQAPAASATSAQASPARPALEGKRDEVAGADAAAARERAKDVVIPTPTPPPAAPRVAELQDARARQFQAKAAPVPVQSSADSVFAKANALARGARADSTRVVAREESLAGAARVADAKRIAVSPDSVIESERRRLLGETRSQLRVPSVVTTGTAVANEQRPATNLTVTTAVGCYDLRRSDAARDAGVPSAVRLANVPVRVGSRTLRMAVPQGDAAGEGDQRWYWSLGRGAILLHKVVGGVVEYEGPVVAVRRAC